MAEHLTGGHSDPSTALSLVMMVMSLACLVCAYHLWTAPTRSTWVTSGLMYGAMIVTHLALALVGGGHHTMHMHGMAMEHEQAGPHWMAIPLTAIAAAQIFLAVWALRRRTGYEDDSPGNARATA
ncbi:hypothetical protein [Sphaerisporangium sp. NPDC051011]|uniref:hypothetical protein n=1 Tax=Sphaerisporangium sp. NPDC051011 TaxID=3155792 RepID=UPI0034065D35